VSAVPAPEPIRRAPGPRAALPPLLDQREIATTVSTILAVQLDNGMIPWFVGGHADPWNHVEAAMALSVGGEAGAAVRAYEWLAGFQHDDGGWYAYYTATGVEDARRDTNVCAYVATGVWHHHLVTGDGGFLVRMWPVVERAIGFVLSFQLPGGEVLWNVDADGVPGRYALLTGSSSIYFSLRCAVAIAEALGHERPDWELAAGRLRHAIAFREDAFEPKQRFAMDWYYPVLVGAVTGAVARERLRERWAELVMDGKGVRCVSDRPWVTTAETAECALACMAAGLDREAATLLGWLSGQRGKDGSYSTGLVYPQLATFPTDERSTYSAAAIVLANDALEGRGAASRLFRGEGLPGGLDLESDAVEDPA
jgi:RES domain-containing protein